MIAHIATTKSLVSAGTERMLVDFGKANLLDKARQQPDKVKLVLDKTRTEGTVNLTEVPGSAIRSPGMTGDAPWDDGFTCL